MHIPILRQTPHFVVLNKPAGLPVHPGPRGGPSVEDFFPQLSRRKDGPWLVHRLDADTAGCLVVALRRAALVEAQALFAAGRAEKTYSGARQRHSPATPSGHPSLPPSLQAQHQIRLAYARRSGLGPARHHRLAGGRPGSTDRERLAGASPAHRPQVPIRSGPIARPWPRHPILGDPVYGDGNGPLQLLARAISLPLATPLAAVAPPPPHMAAQLPQFAPTGAPK